MFRRQTSINLCCLRHLRTRNIDTIDDAKKLINKNEIWSKGAKKILYIEQRSSFKCLPLNGIIFSIFADFDRWALNCLTDQINDSCTQEQLPVWQITNKRWTI
ncbi:hypothetical protein ACOME3_010257 [Neoechinorhynchus agilis]